jgi:hypothetical protein
MTDTKRELFEPEVVLIHSKIKGIMRNSEINFRITTKTSITNQ